MALLLTLVATAAFADKKEKKGKKQDKEEETVVRVTFSVDERHAVESWFVEKHGRGHCPPGLAKKNNGCLPPGQAKKRYAVGQPLAREIVIVEPPPELVVRIGAPGPGYRYAVVDGDLVKLAIGTGLVVDAIRGLID
jgi:Ni/Co efflux regulator RcnB